MAKKQEESSILKGYKGSGEVLKKAAADGKAKPVAAETKMDAPYKQAKSMTFKEVEGGFKLCWTKPGEWSETEAVAVDFPAAMKIAEAYFC